ncbi:hypothetical protein CERSUDRAFT_133354, partial [Gelatoporia subvermispora B]
MMYELLMRETTLHRHVAGVPNVLTLHAVFESSNYMYLVLDYCPGGTLYDHIMNGAFEQNNELIRKVFLQILNGVHACHEEGVFHRDLKPENILCTRDGSAVYVADFGLATDELVSEEFGCGSPSWMSPVQCADLSRLECIGFGFSYAPYSSRQSDVWALGVILINMIASCFPWGNAVVEDAGFKAFLDDPHSLYDRMPISHGLCEILERVFDVNPSERMTIPELRRAVA